MKKLTKIFVIVLSVALLVGAMVLVASAAEKDVAWDENNYAIAIYTDAAAFEADKADGKYESAAKTFNDLDAAFKFLKANVGQYSYIAFTNDYNVGGLTGGSYSSISMDAGSGSNVTLDLNGCTINVPVVQVRETAEEVTDTNNRYHFLTTKAGTTVTIIGNGATVETAVSFVQHNETATLNIDGGEGGLTIKAINGYNYITGTKTLEKRASAVFAGSYFIKLASPTWTTGLGSAPVLNMTGNVDFIRTYSSVMAGVEVTGVATLNIGSTDPSVSTHVTYVEPTNLGAEQKSNDWRCRAFGYGFITFTFGSKYTEWDKNTIVAKANINNATVDTFGSRVAAFDSNFSKVGDDDVPKLTIKDSVVTMDDFVANTSSAIGSNNAHSGMFLLYWNSKVHVDIESSVIRQNHGHTVFNGGNSPTDAQKNSPANALVTVKDSSVLSRNVKDSGAYPMMRYVGAAVFENSFVFADTVATYGATWRPYSAEDTVVTDWPWYVDQGITTGVGVMVKEGCTTNITNVAGRRNNADDASYDKAHGKVPLSGSVDDGTAVYAVPGFYIPVNYQTYDFTEDDATATSTRVGSLYLVQSKATGSTSPLSAEWKKDHIIYPFTPGTMNGLTASSTSKTGGTHDGLSLINTDRTGVYTFENNPTDTDNVYAVVRNGNYKASSTSGPYFYRNIGRTTSATATGSHTVGSPTNYSIDNYQYYVLDVDVMTPTGTFPKGSNFSLRFKNAYINSSGAEDSRASEVNLNISESGSITASGASGSYQLDCTPGKWHHLTIVVEMPLKEDKSAVKLGTLRDDADMHLYVDGVKVKTFTGVFPNANFDTASYYYYAEGTSDSDKGLDGVHNYAGLNEIRINSSRVTSDPGTNPAFAFDNIGIYYVPVTMGATLDEALAASIFREATSSKDLPVAGYSSKYAAQDEAEVESLIGKYAAGVADGSVTDGALKLYCDYAGEALDPYKIAKAAGGEFTSFTYVSNGFDLPFLEAICTVEEAETAGTYKVTLRDDVAIVTFDDLDPTTENETFYITKDSAASGITFPTIKNPQKITLKYGELILDGWGLEAGKDAITADTVIDGDVTLYPAIKSTRGTYSDGVYFNLALQDNLAINLYVPEAVIQDEVDGLNFVEFNYQYDKDNTWSKTSGYVEDDYHRYTIWPSIYKFNDKINYKLIYTSDYEGKTYTFEAVYQISALVYCEYVLANNYTAQEKELVANFLRYGREYIQSLALRNPSTTSYSESLAAIDVVYGKYAHLCTKYDNSILTENIIDTATVNAEIGKYIGDITLSANRDRLQFILSDMAETVTIGEGEEAVTYKVGVKTITVSALGPVVKNGKLTTGTFTLGAASNCEKNDGYYTKYLTQNSKPHYIFNEMTITAKIDLIDAEGNVVKTVTETGKYNLATYYSKISEASKPNYTNLFLALNELSKSANAYRYYAEEK